MVISHQKLLIYPRLNKTKLKASRESKSQLNEHISLGDKTAVGMGQNDYKQCMKAIQKRKKQQELDWKLKVEQNSKRKFDTLFKLLSDSLKNSNDMDDMPSLKYVLTFLDINIYVVRVSRVVGQNRSWIILMFRVRVGLKVTRNIKIYMTMTLIMLLWIIRSFRNRLKND